MMEEHDVRDRLDAVHVPPTRLDVQALLGAGRRRVLRRRAVQAGCAAALGTALLLTIPTLVMGVTDRAPAPYAAPAASPSAPARGAVRCAPATRLPVPPGMTSLTADAVDPTGRYIVGNDTRGRDDSGTAKVTTIAVSRPVLWTDGQPRALPTTDRSVRASGVNAAGVVVALAGDKQWDSVIRYVDGVPTTLNAPPGDWTFEPYPRINAGGDIVASAKRRNQPDAKGVVLLWKAGSPTATKLPLPAGAESRDITDDGTIVGDVQTGPSIPDLASYAWDQQGHGRKLTVPTGESGAVNAAQGDWATGNLWPSGQVARWNLRTGEVTPLDVHAPAHAVNAEGWIVTDGSLRVDGTAVTLTAAGDDTGEPTDVSDTGRVVGSLLDYGKDRTSTVSSGPLTWQCGR